MLYKLAVFRGWTLDCCGAACWIVVSRKGFCMGASILVIAVPHVAPVGLVVGCRRRMVNAPAGRLGKTRVMGGAVLSLHRLAVLEESMSIFRFIPCFSPV